ncbi:MAG: MATE family efflux transporter, partial [Myxococcota bacterium]
MSTVPRLKRILFLALPIIGGMVSQNILNLVDTGMVGALGDQALAAVGLGGIANFLATAFVLGMGAGVQAICARRVGEGKLNESAVPLNGGLLLAVSVSIPWAILLWFLVPFVFPYFIDDSAVVDQGIPYLQARVLAMTAMAMNVCFRGFWNATDRSWLYMSTLIVMHVTNIFLNWVLIYGNLGAPRLGAEGAGVASAIATWLGTVVYVGLAVHFARGQGFLARRPSGAVLRSILKLSIPNGIQQTFFAGGMFTFHLIVGQMGTAQLAASNVIVNLLLVGILPGIGFGLAGMSLVGQALGRGEPEDARR